MQETESTMDTESSATASWSPSSASVASVHTPGAGGVSEGGASLVSVPRSTVTLSR